MRPRCVELHRVLKKTGSFYYHCDWHASHYVKVMLDQIFGENNFVNEIVWNRSDAKSDVGQGAKHFGRVHDSIFYYADSDTYTFNPKFTPLPQSTVDSWYKHVEEGTGRRYNKADVTGPGGRGERLPGLRVERHHSRLALQQREHGAPLQGRSTRLQQDRDDVSETLPR
jgi:hypothetical protein